MCIFCKTSQDFLYKTQENAQNCSWILMSSWKMMAFPLFHQEKVIWKKVRKYSCVYCLNWRFWVHPHEWEWIVVDDEGMTKSNCWPLNVRYFGPSFVMFKGTKVSLCPLSRQNLLKNSVTHLIWAQTCHNVTKVEIQ